jgi:hypothetical protein
VVKTEEKLGNKQVGMDYLEKLAQIVQGQFDTKNKEWGWGVKRHGQYIMIDDYLMVGKQWKGLIETCPFY